MSCTIFVENIHGEIIPVDVDSEKPETVEEFSRRLYPTDPCEDYRPASITRDLHTLQTLQNYGVKHESTLLMIEQLSRGGLFPPEDEHRGLTRNGSNDDPRPLMQQLEQ